MTRQDVSDAYTRFGHLVFGRCRRILRDPVLAEDAVQETFLRLWRSGDGYVQADSKVAWLYRVAERCCFDLLEKKKRTASRSPEVLDRQAGGATANGYDEQELVLRLLGDVDERVRTVALLYYLDEQTQEEIATATGWSRQTIWKKLGEVRAHALRLAGRGGET